MRKNITEENQTLGASLRLPYEKLATRTYAQLSANGFEDVRAAHSVVFRHILPDGSRLTELAERAQMTKQSMSYLVDYLHQRDYLQFSPDPLDGRAKLVRLAKRGIAFQQAAMELSKQVEDELAAQLGAGNMEQLRALLQQLDHSITTLPDTPDQEKA